MLPIVLLVIVAGSIPLPSPAQVWYVQSEIHALVHFNMDTFTHNDGCSKDNWNVKPPYAIGPTSDPYTFQPKHLNTSQWADVMLELGAKGAILTAKHLCGHLLWPTKTTLPDGSPYPYSVGRNRSYIQYDVLSSFWKSMNAAGIKHGFYYSLNANFFLNYGVHASSTLLPGQYNVSKEEYETIAIAQLEELWTNYGELGEIWFDGGYTKDLAKNLTKLLAHQEFAIGFSGYGISKNPSTWIGTETGEPDCPNGIWSSGSFCGVPNGTDFMPRTCDTTLQINNRWFWNYKATDIRDLKTMIDVYHSTVGNNGVLELDFAINDDGLVAPEHESRYREFGVWIKSCYGVPINATKSQGKKICENMWRYSINTTVPTEADRVVVRENIAHGQRVLSWRLMENEVTIANGTNIGNRKVVLLQKNVNATAFVLVVRAMAEPVLMQFDMFKPCESG